MKVMITGFDYPDDTLARNMQVTLLAMGHSSRYAHDFPWMYYRNSLLRFAATILSHSPRFEVYRSQYIGKQVILQKPDVFISVFAWLRPEVVKDIRDEGISVVLVFPDAIVNLGKQYALIAPYHKIFFKDPYAVRTFKEKTGSSAEYLPEACNPMWHKPLSLDASDLLKYGCDITTASNMYPYRIRVMECLEGYNMKLWGPPWPVWLDSSLRSYHTGIDVRELEKAKAYNAAKIIVNTLHYGEIEGVNCRTFEVAGCGGFQIADLKPALPDLFVPGQEIVTFNSREELKDKVDYYLCHDSERMQIARAGHLRAYRDHTYTQRIQQIFRSLCI